MRPSPRKKLSEISALDGYFGRHCGRWWTVAERPKLADCRRMSVRNDGLSNGPLMLFGDFRVLQIFYRSEQMSHLAGLSPINHPLNYR
jgi:hypothetical protein